MKDTIIIIIILLIIILGGVLLQEYILDSSNQIIDKLQSLKGNIEIAEQTGENRGITEQADEIYNDWKELDEKWAVIVLHDELDLIETSLISVKASIEVDNLDISVEEIEKSIFLLNHIYEKEKFCLKNIF